MSYIVTGAAAVARVDGADRYYYRGQTIADKPQNVQHLLDAGLIEAVKAEPKPEPVKPSDSAKK